MLEPSIVHDDELDILMIQIKEIYGYDFTNYSRASLKRRVNRLCQRDGFGSFAQLHYNVMSGATYMKHFIEEITVNVTEMFRDPLFFKELRENVLPQLGTYPVIRIWIAGCSTGEEAYSLAIILKELNLYHKALIYATDINLKVLEQARSGIFPLQYMKNYTENYRLSGGMASFSDYYSANYDKAIFSKELRERIILSSHNLVSDGSFNSFQLIICRNVLIYFDKILQNRVFRLFNDSLENFGYLALGSKETLRFSEISEGYTKLDNQKIWKKLQV